MPAPPLSSPLSSATSSAPTTSPSGGPSALGPGSDPAPILVAVDDDATPALEYAAQAARRVGCGLHLLHVIPPGSPPAAHDAGERLLRSVAAHAAALGAGDGAVTTELAHAGPVADVLVQRASTARQLVLQCRHDESGTGTCSLVVCRAPCPVVMVPSRRRTATRVPEHEALRISTALPGSLP